MRLYVFRGVPMDTHFEPKTRKEISKIDWYSLTDLPTAKRSKHPDGSVEPPVVNANKFYMVAPFLVPLKKWVTQQRKRDNRPTSQPQLAASHLLEETVTEDEPDGTNGNEFPPFRQVLSRGPSDLPEVSITLSTSHDPSSQLKQLLNISVAKPIQHEAKSVMAAPPRVDETKSNALLALLRQGTTAASETIPHTPLEQVSYITEVPRSPRHTQPRPPPFSTMSPPPRFPLRPELAALFPSPYQNDEFPAPVRYQTEAIATTARDSQLSGNRKSLATVKSTQPTAPYRQTGDPQFARQTTQDQQVPSVPPASALPKLTNHTRSLLDVFKGGPVSQSSRDEASGTVAKQGQTLTQIPAAIYTKRSMGPPDQVIMSMPPDASLPSLSKQSPSWAPSPMMEAERPKSQHQSSLLNLFRQPMKATMNSSVSRTTIDAPAAPVELAAQLSPGLAGNPSVSTENLEYFLQQNTGRRPQPGRSTKSRATSTAREGKTSATISGPLNQPQFDSIAQSLPRPSASDDFTRSPTPATRTLFDPNQPPNVKILARPDDIKRSPARSPRISKSAVKLPQKSSPVANQSMKSFQPQILRRPQAGGLLSSPQLAAHILPQKPPAKSRQPPASVGHALPPKPPAHQVQPRHPPRISSPRMMQPPPLSTLLNSMQANNPEGAAQQFSPTGPTQSSTSRLPVSPRQTSQDPSHRQNLLSLFNKPPPASGPISISQNTSGNGSQSPASISQLVSPMNDKEMNGAGAISTRSRMGSMASVVSGVSQAPTTEKRQTTAGDRAFLLGYLGRIANQET